MFVRHDPLGVAVIRPSDMSDASRHVLRKAVHKLLPECPTAILFDLSDVDSISRLMQMTLLSFVIEAAQEPVTPLAFCTAKPDLINDLTQTGPPLRVFTDVAAAQRALTTSAHGTAWIHRSLGSGNDAPSVAARQVAEACLMWRLTEIQEPARNIVFHLVWMARGPYDLSLTMSLRPGRRFLLNVRNYSTGARATAARNIRLRLDPTDEARLLAKGAAACGRVVTSAGVAWWANLHGDGSHP